MERRRLARAEEAVGALAAGRAVEPARAERVLDLARQRGARRDYRRLRTEHPLDDRPHERIVRAAEDHRVDAGLAQRGAVAAHLLDERLVDRRLLDSHREVATRHRDDLDERVDRGDRVGVCAGRDRGRRAEHADLAAPRRRDRLDRGRLHDAEHLDAERRLHQPLAQGGQRRGRRRVAGDDQQLDPPRDQRLGDLERELLQLLGRAGAVGQPRRVREVQVVLVREPDEQLVQHGQPADAGVEDPDRPAAHLIGGDGHRR